MIHDVCKQAKPKREIAFESLIQAICFSAIVSATPEQCMSILGRDREVCIRNSRLAVEQTLKRANLTGTQDTQVLQAAVLFLLCLRWFDSRLAWAQTAIVIRVAQRQRVHRDGQFCGLNPFNTEMRRRLWWHICILDMLCSEDEGTDTQIRPEMFDTKIPSNIDIDNLAPDLNILSPAPSGFTDITLCIIQCEMMTNLFWAGINLNPDSTQSPMPERESVLCSLATRIEEQYLREFDLNIPIQWLTAVIARLSLSKARVVSLLNNSKPGEVPIATNDEIFQMAVEIVKFANLIQKNEPTARWAWLCKSYKQRHTVAFILSELCIRPISAETDQAWELATEMYNQWEKEGYAQDGVLQTTLSRLMERATISRTRKLESRGGRHDYRASLPVPRSIVQESYPVTAPPPELDVDHSSTLGLEGMDDLLDEQSPFTFSAMDWLVGPLL
ncbi:C6 transcription factor [Penicillium cataractarum]|uniref:C6 transcription factor n=1 Tax=Penicillium cataractarum TaxID=2100454 RepID=A0A9W9S0G9_9EURO|nr:C6 transcription factor [Penicillium cataractarum]KAJ5369768.1 C6 transcription factor [Penicillium cataractarum]